MALTARHFFITKPAPQPAELAQSMPLAESGQQATPGGEKGGQALFDGAGAGIPSPQIPEKTPEGSEIFLTGILQGRGKLIAVMSDGTTRTHEDNIPRKYRVEGAGETPLTYATRNFVIWDKKRYYIKPRLDNRQPAVRVEPLPRGNETQPKPYHEKQQQDQDQDLAPNRHHADTRRGQDRDAPGDHSPAAAGDSGRLQLPLQRAKG